MKKTLFFLCLSISTFAAAETNFIAINATTEDVIKAIGPSLNCEVTPCCTFNFALSLIGYDCDILQDEENPLLLEPGIDISLESHKDPQTPKSWMALSVVWYSKLLMQKMRKQSLQNYLRLFSYGNQNISGNGNFTLSHLSSSLKISPKEQVLFLKKLVLHTLPVSSYALAMTKAIIPHKVLDSGWTLYGKTGSGFEEDEAHKIAWYVGWVEKKEEIFIFALLIKDMEVFPTIEERQKLVLQFFEDFNLPHING